VSTKKQSQRIVSIVLIRTDEILQNYSKMWKFGGLIPESTQDTPAVAFPTKTM